MNREATHRSFDLTERQDVAKSYGAVCNHHHHVAIMESGHLLTRSFPTHLEVSSVVFPGSFCLLVIVSY